MYVTGPTKKEQSKRCNLYLRSLKSVKEACARPWRTDGLEKGLKHHRGTHLEEQARSFSWGPCVKGAVGGESFSYDMINLVCTRSATSYGVLFWLVELMTILSLYKCTNLCLRPTCTFNTDIEKEGAGRTIYNNQTQFSLRLKKKFMEQGRNYYRGKTLWFWFMLIKDGSEVVFGSWQRREQWYPWLADPARIQSAKNQVWTDNTGAGRR